MADNDTDSPAIKKGFKLLSWNIDGLDRRYETLETRTRAIVALIQREEPDAVFLQEVIPTSLALICTLLPEYDSSVGDSHGYFVAIFTLRRTLTIDAFDVVPYPSTTMSRNLLIVETVYRGLMKVDLMTSHHESCKPAAGERIQQLKLCFRRMLDAPADRVVLFGGDLNMRDEELRQVGGIPQGICDLWIENGRSAEHNYTWDMTLNTNLGFASNGFLPRCRFDRLYFRPATSSSINFKPVSFRLEGREMIQSIQRFCSDHWAIQAEFETVESSIA